VIRRWLGRHRDVWVCALVVTVISCAALMRLGLLSPSNQQDVLVVDSARTAYVAKNLIEGHGYTTNDLPASLVGFYDQSGRLDDARWLNADRFPLAAYATAILYAVTGRHDAWTGVILYNLIVFVGFLTALYVLARRVTGSRAGGAIAVALALLHNHTYVFLYMKDADMLLLAVFTLSCFQTYFARPFEARSTPQMAWFGTVLAWSFLARPNVGAPFMVALLPISVYHLIRAGRRLGAATAVRKWLKTDLVAGVVAAAWLLPFMLHSLAEWGSPFFSVNGMYQPILGTRYGMGTDTWWRYLPRGFDYSVGHLWREARGEVIAKFVTSWRATLRTFVSAYFVDVALGLAATQLPRRTGDEPAAPRAPGLRGAAIVMLIVFAFNFALLPLYAYKEYSWRHYLGFVLPLVWVGAACTLLHLGAWMAPIGRWLRDQARSRPQLVAAIAAAVLVVLSLRTPGSDGDVLAMAVTRFWQSRWLLATLTLLSLLALRRWRRWSGTTWLVVIGMIALIALYRPHKGHKNFTHIHVPASKRVWAELRQRDGVVASFALQTLVPWNTGRKNVMAPEFVMNLYEMRRAHHLSFEDIYIESPEAALAPYDGLFGRAAPGFEGYLRLVQYRDHLPGYRLAFHEETRVGVPKYKIAPRPKSSTVYTLSDPAAIDRLLRTPTSIAIGEPASVVHTAHGFGGYYTIDGKPVVAATDASTKRYLPGLDRPWEDTSVTFFVDAARPARVTVQYYTVAPGSFTFYWNLDLDEYTPARARAGHLLGEVTATGPGWQTATLDIPPALVRTGLNKLGFKAGAPTAVALCGTQVAEALCARTTGTPSPTMIVRADTAEPSAVVNLSMFMHRLDFELAGP
jgi:hypothetical protein